MLRQKVALLLSFFIFYFTLVSAVSSEGFDFTCQSHTTQGYGYRLFFKVPSSSQLKNGEFQFHFSLSGQSNGHILLSEQPNTLHAYEIVLGAGDNGFSVLRKFDNNKSDSKADIITNGILSSSEIRNFSINISQGKIVVSSHNNGTIKTLLVWKDPTPINIKLMSFCAWTGVTVVWYYDCKGVKPVELQLSAHRKLKDMMLKGYDPYSIPVKHDGQLAINTSIVLHHFNLDIKKYIMTTHAQFQLSWNDFRIKWNPTDFENISSIHLLHREVWLPEFIVHNSINAVSSPHGNAIIKVSHKGEISWSPKFQMLTWCDLNLKDWPFDSHFCSVKIGLIPYPSSVYVSLLQQIQPSLALKNSEWKIMSILGMLDTNYGLYEYNETESEDEKSQSLSLIFELERQSNLYVYTYIIPVIGSIVTVLTSFWLPAFSRKRLLLHSTCFMLLLINLLALDKAVPLLTTSPPYILRVCCNMLILATLHIIFCSFILSISKSDQTAPSKFIRKIVTNNTVQTFLCIFGKYETIEESSCFEEDSGVNKDMSLYALFGIILDRLLFGLSLLYICVILIL